METRVSVEWLKKWINTHSKEVYEKYPIMPDYPTKKEALDYLRKLIEMKVKWI